MKLKTLLALSLTAAPMMSWAHNIEVGHSLPSVMVASHGEVILDGDKTAYTDWKSEQLNGKVRIIQAIAGRKSSKKMNAPLMTAITAAKFSPDNYQTTTIINQDDSMWGTGSFVKSSAEDSKQEFSWSSIVVDEDGLVANTWDLAEESSAIIALDKMGKVLFVKEGALTEQEITDVLAKVKASL
ncbi:YtfJ family protein [Vibrio tapetis]|uniref:Putative transcriptional regulator n=1 Tax=Vibrio tapetis subsp. tapetis TaxID=1671868 RepID=A0A2N8ZFF2_9VIBR|nr:YtfJ family protein [Vibrio tapetis]SON50642.1 putative transcriptional regulator [Vibrio tapetis subsp. tapetis]